MFTYPLFLIGSLAAGVPLAIHLMHRRESRSVPWPSLRFLKASDRRTARRRQVEQLLLLVLRMALLAFLSAALSRPVIRAFGIGGGGETAAVIVLDNSMSMQAPAAKSTRFARAKRAAEELLKGLPAGSWVALRLADGSEPEGAHALTKNSGAVAAALRAASAGDARGDMGAAVAGAIADAAASSAASREVHVLTDMQAAAFARAPLGSRAGRPVQVVFTDCGGEPPPNVAITDVAIRARRFVAGAPLGLDVRVKSFSPVDEERKCVLALDEAAGDPEGEAGREGVRAKDVPPGVEDAKFVRLAAKGSSGFSFQFAVDRPGDVTGRVYLSPADGLFADDVRWFRVHLAERIPVLVTERTESRVASARPSFFLATALDPAAGAGGARSPIVPKVTGPGYLAGKGARALVRESPVAILADLGRMDPPEARAWVEYVRAGGTLVAFPSAAGGLEEGAAALQAAAGAAFLPAEVGAPKGGASSESATSGGARPGPRRIDVEGADFAREEVLEPFRDLEPTLRAVTVRRAYDLRATHAAGGRAVLELEGGGAFLAARRFGEGEVFLFAVPAGTEWSDLPARSLFLPLVHTLVYRAAAPRDEERSFLAGSGARITLPPEAAGRTVRLVEPGGRRTDIAATPKGDPGEAAAAAEVSIRRLARAGVYRLEGEVIPQGVALVANVDPEESDPQRTGPARMRELYLAMAGAEPVFVEDPSGLAHAVARVRKGLELWDYVLFMVLSIALFECFYANRLAAGTKGRAAATAGATASPARASP